MNSQIQSLLVSREYSEELQEEVAIRILFSGEYPANVMECLNISSIYVVNNFVNIYRKKRDYLHCHRWMKSKNTIFMLISNV